MQLSSEVGSGEKAALQPSASTATKPKSDTKDYFLIGETILIVGLLSVGLFCYTTSLTSDKADKAPVKRTAAKTTAETVAAVRSKTELEEDNIFDM